MVHHPEFSKTRQRKVKRHFDELCEDERLQDPEGFLTMLFLHRKASKWKMNMKSPIRIERRPMPSKCVLSPTVLARAKWFGDYRCVLVAHYALCEEIGQSGTLANLLSPSLNCPSARLFRTVFLVILLS
ncbi:hypothetical protein EVAR_95795_1 [Eumeta japonica]|uniref:Uncharacterized protein n=1 Tax=Eumeta variegata TaxID=151549 RepID=A0A4C1W4P4_EUMVA|nr:hypothetical protein EVAR_95795_1 [Eumeta japonica]